MISENDKVVALQLHPMTIVNFESGVVPMEIWHFKIVAFNFASLSAINNVILLSDVRFTVQVLEEHGWVVDVEGDFFLIFFQIPDYYSIVFFVLLDSEELPIFRHL
jgi:hypothetical protein